MATTSRRTAAQRWPKPPEDAGPSELIAHEILAAYRDLTPSVDRIMTAGLDDTQRLTAITLFRDSLGSIGDPNRDPRAAIAASLGDGAGA
jgi:hypothetical protein